MSDEGLDSSSERATSHVRATGRVYWLPGVCCRRDPGAGLEAHLGEATRGLRQAARRARRAAREAGIGRRLGGHGGPGCLLGGPARGRCDRRRRWGHRAGDQRRHHRRRRAQGPALLDGASPRGRRDGRLRRHGRVWRAGAVIRNVRRGGTGRGARGGGSRQGRSRVAGPRAWAASPSTRRPREARGNAAHHGRGGGQARRAGAGARLPRGRSAGVRRPLRSALAREGGGHVAEPIGPRRLRRIRAAPASSRSTACSTPGASPGYPRSSASSSPLTSRSARWRPRRCW